jgi:hypothetical protein
MRLRLALGAFVATVAGSLAAVPYAAALEPGVHVTPGSPAAKEYGFPLSVLRGAASGHAAPQGGAEPLFGVGIGPATAGGVQGAASSTTSPTRGSSPISIPTRGGTVGALTRGHVGGLDPTRRAGAASGAPLARNVRLASLVHTSSTTPRIALLVVPVLLVGLGLGAGIVIARRRLS